MKSRTGLKLSVSDMDVVRCFDAALKNVASINTVRCSYRRYNKTGLLTYPYMLRAGRDYKAPWTRDASINTWQAMNFIDVGVSRTTLLAVCSLNDEGEPVIQSDVQTWDRIVWATGAYNYYLTTGDEEFLRVAHGVIGRALEMHRKNSFNAKYGLFVGGSFFNDGIAGYPVSCHKEGLRDSFAPSHPLVEKIMCLSTNCLYCEAYRIYAEISEQLGFISKADEARNYREELKETINKYFWSDELGRYRYIVFPDGNTDDSQELSGHAFAVLFDICPAKKQAKLFENTVTLPGGTVSIWPPFKGLYSEEKPGRHNNVVWPFLNGMMIQAAAKSGQLGFAGDELMKITNLIKGSNFRFSEIYSPYTEKPFGGWQVGRKWDSCRDQTWSAACYIGAVIFGVFGIKAEINGIVFEPCVPEACRDAELRGVKIRNQELSVKIKGYGRKIDKLFLDGMEHEPFIPWGNKPHRVEIVMSND